MSRSASRFASCVLEVGVGQSARDGEIGRVGFGHVEERARIVGVLNSPPLRIALAAADGAVETAPEQSEEAAQYAALLKEALGDGFPLKVGVTAVQRRGGPGFGMMHGFDKGGGMPGGGRRPFAVLLFVVQTQLHDGTAVTLDARRPQDAPDEPFIRARFLAKRSSMRMSPSLEPSCQ